MKTNIKHKLYFIIFMMLFCCFSCFVNAEDEIQYAEYKKGDEVKYNGIEFYVIEDSDKTKDSVTLLKKYALEVEEINKYGIDENGINHVNRYTSLSVGTAHDAYRAGGMAYYSSESCGYVNGLEVTDGCASENATSYDSSDVKYVVDNWAKNNLKEEALVEDSLGYKTRLLTLDELLRNFSYTEQPTPSSLTYWADDNNPFWLYRHTENNISYEYWTMSPYQDSDNKIFFIASDRTTHNITSHYEYQVRPVVTLKKESIRTGNLHRVKSVTSKEFKIGDIVEYNGVKFYAIENSDETKNTVALLKAEPLTTTEVNKYGKGYINKDTETKEAIDHNGYGYIAYYSSDTCTDYSENPIGCTSEYDASDIKYVVDKWSNDVLQGLKLTEDKTGYKVRLITKEEIIDNLSFSVNSSGIYHASIDTPYWVYSEFYSYLTMSPADDSNSNVFTISSTMESATSSFHPSFGYTSFKGAVRPVIILDKGIDNKVIEKVEVPDTKLSASLILGVIATIIIIISFVTFYIVLKRRKSIK